MNALKPSIKKPAKSDRERRVLLGLVEHYLKTGKPVGSNTLKDFGFEDLSSATIRNYFANLEEEGYLTQQHSSGGRIPTDKAFRLYAHEVCEMPPPEPTYDKSIFNAMRTSETREITAFLQKAAEQLSSLSHAAVFLSAPRFEQDFVTGMKLIPIDSTRSLCVLITDFGEVVSEIMHTPSKLTAHSAKRIENYFNFRLTGQNKPEHLDKTEEKLAQDLYNELMVRYVVNSNNFSDKDIYRTGFSSLLIYPEFHDPALLANSLGLFENVHGMRLLLKECNTHNKLKFWIGEDLANYAPHSNPNCSVLAIPYHVNNQPVGAIGLLGPTRIPYRPLFGMLQHFAQSISEALTKNLYKFKISMRQPRQETIDLKKETALIGTTKRLLLENKR